MPMRKNDDTRRKLAVKKETLRTLAAAELEQVNGGGPPRNNCTGRLSGCISRPE